MPQEIWYDEEEGKKRMNIVEVRPHLYRIALPQKMRGFQKFIGSWVFDGDCPFVVDVGPKASFEELLRGLKTLNLKRLDFIFLTHIHIDHAGATGSLIRHFPQSNVICHGSGVHHLVDPRRLWEGSKKTLGELAFNYGEIDPVPEKNLLPSERFNRMGFKVINTPGHAAHHVSLVFGDYLFAGGAAGVFFDLGSRIYLRPATPVRFMLGEAMGSVDRLLENGGKEICYAHSGIHSDARQMLQRYKDQLCCWREVITEQMEHSRKESLTDHCVTALIENDESLRVLEEFTEEDRERELYFIRNSIEGFIQYLKTS